MQAADSCSLDGREEIMIGGVNREKGQKGCRFFDFSIIEATAFF